jgi:hypothetical protein
VGSIHQQPKGINKDPLLLQHTFSFILILTLFFQAMKLLLFISVLITLSMVVYSASTPKDFGKDRQIQLAALYDTIVKILENIIKEIPEHLDVINNEKEAVEDTIDLINRLKDRKNGKVNICLNIKVVMELIQNPFGDKVPKPFPINNLNELIDAHGLADSSLNQADIDAIITATDQLKNFLSKQTSRQPQPSKEKDPVQSRQSQLPKENDPVQSQPPKNVSTQSPSLLTLLNGLSCAGGLVIGCILGTLGYGVLLSKKTTSPVTVTSSVRRSKKSQGPKKKTHKRIKP